MSFEPDNLDADLSVIDLLQAILIELKRLNVMISEMTDEDVDDGDLE